MDAEPEIEIACTPNSRANCSTTLTYPTASAYKKVTSLTDLQCTMPPTSKRCGAWRTASGYDALLAPKPSATITGKSGTYINIRLSVNTSTRVNHTYSGRLAGYCKTSKPRWDDDSGFTWYYYPTVSCGLNEAKEMKFKLEM